MGRNRSIERKKIYINTFGCQQNEADSETLMGIAEAEGYVGTDVIEEADLILVMRDGKIIEQGNHESLLAKKGFYHTLYHSQFEN